MVKKDKEGIAGVAVPPSPEPNIVSPTLDQMNMRDLIAMFALLRCYGGRVGETAQEAYAQADAMLEERSKQ